MKKFNLMFLLACLFVLPLGAGCGGKSLPVGDVETAPEDDAADDPTMGDPDMDGGDAGA